MHQRKHALVSGVPFHAVEWLLGSTRVEADSLSKLNLAGLWHVPELPHDCEAVRGNCGHERVLVRAELHISNGLCVASKEARVDGFRVDHAHHACLVGVRDEFTTASYASAHAHLRRVGLDERDGRRLESFSSGGLSHVRRCLSEDLQGSAGVASRRHRWGCEYSRRRYIAVHTVYRHWRRSCSCGGARDASRSHPLLVVGVVRLV
mmetsp:Transcript_8144/g.16212  ORF Transcript_8144/g.16212 Transcript_8144/m.16212 type:complete len:206 (-) Transcript_8144:679-1296(-)